MTTVREVREVFSSMQTRAREVEDTLERQGLHASKGIAKRRAHIESTIFQALRQSDPAAVSFEDPEFTRKAKGMWKELLRTQAALQGAVDAFEKEERVHTQTQIKQAQAHETDLLAQKERLHRELGKESVLEWAKQKKIDAADPKEREKMEAAGWLGALLIVEIRDARKKMQAVQEWETQSGREFWSAWASTREKEKDLVAIARQWEQAVAVSKGWAEQLAQHEALKTKLLLPQQAKDRWATQVSEAVMDLPLRAFDRVSRSIAPKKAEDLKETLAVVRTLEQAQTATQAYRQAAEKIADDLETPLKKMRRASSSAKVKKIDLAAIEKQLDTALTQLEHQQAAVDVSIPRLLELEQEGSKVERAAMIQRSYGSSSDSDSLPVWLWVWMGLQNPQHCMALGHPSLATPFSAQNLDASGLAGMALSSNVLDTPSVAGDSQGLGASDAALMGIGAGLGGLGVVAGMDALGGLPATGFDFAMPDVSVPAFAMPDLSGGLDMGSVSSGSDWSSAVSSVSDFSSTFDSSSFSSSFDTSSSSNFDSGGGGW